MAASARGLTLRRRRYGPETERLVAKALERELWSAERWRAFREERLAFLLHRAATAVPYYRRYWEERRRKGDRATWERIENWPVLKKDSLRASAEAFLAEDRDPRRMASEHTSGTSGTPIRLWRSVETDRAWYALLETRLRRWNGVSLRDRWAMLGGQLVTPASRKKPPFWVWNAGLSQLYMSAYHLSPSTAASYWEALRRREVTHIIGYPSALYSLAEMAPAGQAALPSLRVLISNAEPLSERQRERISRTFEAPVRDTYGMVEIVCAASECNSGRMHLWPEVGVLEVLAEESDEPVPAGEAGRFVCTGLVNPDMPLVRYEIGDRGSLATGQAPCACGRLLPALAQIEGRLDDVLVTPDGRRVGRLDPVFKSDLGIREAQIVQESLNRVVVRVVASNGFKESHAETIVREMRQRLGGDVSVTVERVEEIPRTKAGKFRGVVSLLSGREAARHD